MKRGCTISISPSKRSLPVSINILPYPDFLIILVMFLFLPDLDCVFIERGDAIKHDRILVREEN